MKDLFIVTHASYASGLTPGTSDYDDLGSLAVGAFAIIGKDPSDATYYNKVLAAAQVTQKLFQFVSMGNGGLNKSPILTAASTKMIKQAVVSAVAKVVVIGNTTSGGTTYSLNLPTIAAGKVYGFVVSDLSKPVYQLSRDRYYTYTSVTGDDGVDIVAALIATVNNDSKAIVTAAVAYTDATDGIKLTHKTAGKPFAVSMIGEFQRASVTTSTALVYPQGDYAALTNIEKDKLVQYGKKNGRYDEAFNYTSLLNSAKNYITYKITTQVPVLRDPKMSENEPFEMLIAADSSLATTDNTYSVPFLNALATQLGV